MTTTPSTLAPTPRRPFWRWVFAGLGLCALIVLVGIMNVLSLNCDASALRQELFASLRVPATPHVQISVGPGLLTLARTALAFIDDVPPEARRAVRAVRAASVGVYGIDAKIDRSARARMLPAADAAMDRRGWMRIVAVSNDRETVLIYTPERHSPRGTQRVCLAVCTSDQIVVVSAEVQTDALVELVREQQLLANL